MDLPLGESTVRCGVVPAAPSNLFRPCLVRPAAGRIRRQISYSFDGAGDSWRSRWQPVQPFDSNCDISNIELACNRGDARRRYMATG